jgi:hypothetical protein
MDMAQDDSVIHTFFRQVGFNLVRAPVDPRFDLFRCCVDALLSR